MAKDHRIIQNGQRLDYTCDNNKFQTNINMGYPHGGNPIRGSAFPHPLHSVGGWSLWLEHVSQKDDPEHEWFWLMWYDDNRRPTIPLSGVMHRQDIANMSHQLAGLGS
jgi:hypothetical protein